MNKIQFRINLIAVAVLFSTGVYAQGQVVNNLNLAPGFKINIFAVEVSGARSLELTSEGALFVGSRGAGNVYALRDTDGDFVADSQYTIAAGLTQPNGVAYRDGSLFVAEINRVIRFDDIIDNLGSPPEYVVVNDSLPSDRSHGWKFIRFGPDGRLYVPVGAPCNICERTDDPRYTSILGMNPDGTGLEIYASGIRNTVGFDWNPVDGSLWFTDNGRDMLGDDLPPDELNRADRKGLHFGYPYCHGGDIPDPDFGDRRDCSEFEPPQMKLGPHVAALGMRFYTGEMFPAEYRNQIFIAEHGSWNRSNKIGYRITLVRLGDNNRAVSYEDFITGWLQDGDNVIGRPVDLEQMPDGSLLISDDYANRIYRLSYEEPVTPSQAEPIEFGIGGAVEFAAADQSLLGEGAGYSWLLGENEIGNGPQLSIGASALSAGDSKLVLKVTIDGKVYSYEWTVRLAENEKLSCDYTGDNLYDIADVIALLLLGRNSPADPLADYNRSGEYNVGDAVALLLDIRNGACV